MSTPQQPGTAVVVRQDNEVGQELAAMSGEGDPHAILEQAAAAAKALQEVIANKPKKVIIQGKQYLECEDWQTVARFFGCTARLEWTKPIEFAGAFGFEARVEVVRLADGVVIGAGESMCMNNESRWNTSPLVHLRSMAQTRAISRALNSVFRWVSVLAGFERTPSEEMEADPRGAQDEILAQKLEPNDKAYLESMALEKKKLTQFELSEGAGEVEYHRILGTYGVKHANDYKKFLEAGDAPGVWVVSKVGLQCFKDVRKTARDWSLRPSPEVGRARSHKGEAEPEHPKTDDFTREEKNDLAKMLVCDGTIGAPADHGGLTTTEQFAAFLQKYEGTKADLMEQAARYVENRDSLGLQQSDAPPVAAQAGGSK